MFCHSTGDTTPLKWTHAVTWTQNTLD